MAADAEHMRVLRDRLEAGLKRGPAVIFGESVERLPNTSLFAVPGLKAETALINLDLDGFAVSSGSACSSGKVTASHVLAAMGIAPESHFRGDPGEHRADHQRKRDRFVPGGLDEARGRPI